MKHERQIDGRPSAQEVRAALERVVASEVMRSSPQLTAFLRFVVEAVLDGHSDRIKGYVIAVEALKRDSRFNPQIDPIVRVEATRLRRTLERYYAGAGADDPIVIALPRGTYVPTFSRRGAAPPGAADGTTVDGAQPGETLAPGNGMPILSVQPFEVAGTPGPRSISAASLHAMLSDAFAHFDLVNIVWDATGSGTPAESRADYRLVGAADYDDDGSTRLRFRLIDTADGNVVWTRVLDVAASDDPIAAQEAIVRELAATLVQPFGVIFAHGRAKSLGAGTGDPRYRCILDAAESFRSFDTPQHLRARTCLERLTLLDPSFALGFTYLAALYVREYLYGLDAHAANMPPLERALRAARRGVELNPESARAYEMLFFTLFARRDLAAAFAAGEQGDRAQQIRHAVRRRLRSAPCRDRRDRQGNGDADARRPRRRRSSGRRSVLSVSRQLSARRCRGRDLPCRPAHQRRVPARAGRARSRRGCGRRARRRSRRARPARRAQPAWGENPRGELEKFFPAAFIVDRLAAGLAAAAGPGE